jgi:hypothetical protein
MRKTLFLLVLFALSLTSVLAQTKAANYAGEWSLDMKKSELPRMMQNVESMTMTVTQDEKTLKTTTSTKGGAREMPAQSISYSLEGKETVAEVGGMMGGTATLKAKIEKDGKLILNSVRKANFQGNEVTITIKDRWELIDEGKTLKISRTTDTPRGSMSSTLYFTKQEAKKAS